MRGLKKNKKVVVAMSGGIDSSVAAVLLKKAGVETVGVFTRLWAESEKDGLIGKRNGYCTSGAEDRARRVAKILNIPFYVFNFEKEFKKRVIDYFLTEYKIGKTPNPCVVCNKKIKFGLLLEKALAMEANFLATGHYARLQKKADRIHLLRGKDKKKDQSYFLWQLNQKQLKHILFPLGNYNKTQVRNLAKKFNLPVLDTPESMEVCFIKTTISDFLAQCIKPKPGPILTIEGKKIGQHQGLPFYTIGQRKEIKLSGGPFYVVDKNLKENTLIVTHFLNTKSLYKKNLIAQNVNWISGKEPKLPLKIKAQIRYGHRAISATITKRLKTENFELVFNKPQRAITPGQSVVFYQNQELLAGGIIAQ